MKPVSIRKILVMEKEKIRLLKSNLSIRFEDNVVVENANFKHIILFRYLMDFVNEVPRFTITREMFIDKHLTQGYFNDDTYKSIYSLVFKQFVEEVVKPNNNVGLIPSLLRSFQKTINLLIRELVHEIGDYVIGVEIQDVLKVQFQKELLGAIVKVNQEPNQFNIEKTYEALDYVVKNKLPNDDKIRLIYLSKMVSISQLQQLFGSRGYLTEIDSKIFAIPMTNSFTLGFKNIYEMAIESRAGAKALFLSSKAIQDSEYMARELQLVTMVVENLEFTDCGNTEYIEYYVKPKEVDQLGNVNYKGDLKNLIGKRFFNEETGKEEIITKDHKWLEGKVIKLRSILTCKLIDKKKVCSACLGELSYAVHNHQNIGHLFTINVTTPISQSIISTKHLTKSASTSQITLNDNASKWFTVKDKNKLYFYSKYFGRKTKRIRLHIPQEEMFGLKEVITNRNVLDINLSKASRLNEIVIEELSENRDSKLEVVPLKFGNKYPYFTTYFWQYVIKHGYEVDDYDNYLVDLKDWNVKHPIIMYDKIEFDFSALSKEFKRLIRKRQYYKKDGKLYSEFTPKVLLEKLFDLVNKKLDINIALLEVIVYAFTAYDITNENYDLGRNSPNNDLIGLKYAIDYRSCGGSYGWSKFQGKIVDPVLHFRKHKPDHPLDVLLRPQEVLEHYRK